MKTKQAEQKQKTRTGELRALGLIIVVLFPVLSVFGIGAYGLVIWVIQAFGGVVSH
ncbi:periplasmic nitrate reductase, NapE protein [Thalassotalea sp. ND16A]|uniref:periplasmic nitrate reductase, NapE protein n=1 Tax=Thalassotalea sp. ND16A TaxID=1535422 RepID=UPI00051CC5B0|nr:periplasmic nitrate reductase, NapE protein [Thalassotalea sp. ND16A]KGJ91085.1 torE, membrane protein TorE [Thalassotalea sp. ND16A]